MYGLLGKKLSHSYSKVIHELITDDPYDLIEVDDVHDILKSKRFKGLNVTIPYKKVVIPYLDELSTIAEKMNVVNTIVNQGGKLIGYNTDYDGLIKTLNYHNISVKNMDVLILGNGSTSRTIQYYCSNFGAKNIYVYARNPKQNEYNLKNVDNLKSVDIIFNATPVGMFPNNTDTFGFDLNRWPNLNSVIDVIYNPLASNLILEAKKCNIQAVNGLMMLVSQAIKSAELFRNVTLDDNIYENTYKTLLKLQTNIVFIGMPMSGKSLYTRIMGNKYHKDVIDIDQEIERETNLSIPEIFETHGEEYFRSVETAIVEKISKLNNKAISCGGGVILNPKNMDMLKQNGIIILLDIDLETLKKMNPKNRPLLQNSKNLEKLFHKRYNLYHNYADIIIHKNTLHTDSIIRQIEVNINEYTGFKWS
jgi:shikimate dehydrogenase